MVEERRTDVGTGWWEGRVDHPCLDSVGRRRDQKQVPPPRHPGTGSRQEYSIDTGSPGTPHTSMGRARPNRGSTSYSLRSPPHARTDGPRGLLLLPPGLPATARSGRPSEDPRV